MGQPAAHGRYYDAQADRYDTYAAGDDWTPNVYLADILAPIAAAARPVDLVLDLGSGTGQSLQVVHELFPAAELVGVDVSAAMLARAAAKVPAAQLEVDDIASYVQRLERDVDLVTAIGCAELVPDLPACLQTLSRHVRPGGHIALSVEPLVDGLGVDLPAYASGSGGQLPDERRVFHWSVADVLGALPGARLIAERLFRAYRRGGRDVLYELLLVAVAERPEPGVRR